ncbi:hypothetical protein [Carboxylicivirga caseinilyticus]|uniref:hypothetical protein n=1 Tax=Carboxylicivirga caseinilyticus TaxID=3417572 RepID=UPI003D34D660|nr:hypothetical protein [Marinilabiliaceae bacterium A049]
MKIKRAYIPPTIETYQIDQEISLIMMSTPGDPGPPDPFSKAPGPSPEYPTTLNSDTPFGGTTPDYDNL